jgi:antirestriction protein ArdC
MMEANEWMAKVEQDIKELAEGTDKARASDFFKEYLDVASKFWRYSLHNQLLIRLQCERASRVAGFRSWQELGRRIRKGEHGIRILAPSLKKIIKLEDNSEGVIVRGFFVVSVFDVSQTEGKDLPQLDVEVKGDDRTNVLDKLIEFCKKKGIVVEFVELQDGFFGASSGGRIVINSSLSVNGRASTLLHEIAHELLHRTEEGKKIDRNQKEVQAEGVAFVVSKAVGLETKSFDYLALFDADYKKIMTNLKTIAEGAKVILLEIAALIVFN